MLLKPLGANRTAIEFNDGSAVLFSYATPVAAFLPGTGYVRTDKAWSRTTSKHITLWLDGANAAIRPQTFFDDMASARRLAA
jgi:hypothetical protein